MLVVILLISRYARGFLANVVGADRHRRRLRARRRLGKMTFDKVGKAPWFDVVTPFAFGAPTFDAVMILTMTLVMIVVMIESTGMFLALSEITGKRITPARSRRRACAPTASAR